MDQEKSVEIDQTKKIEASNNENVFVINRDLELELSFGVSKITLKGFYPRKLSGKWLAFYNDVSLNKLLDTDRVSTLISSRVSSFTDYRS